MVLVLELEYSCNNNDDDNIKKFGFFFDKCMFHEGIKAILQMHCRVWETCNQCLRCLS